MYKNTQNTQNTQNNNNNTIIGICKEYMIPILSKHENLFNFNSIHSSKYYNDPNDTYYNECVEYTRQKTEFIKPQNISGTYKPQTAKKLFTHFTSQFITIETLDKLDNPDNIDNIDNIEKISNISKIEGFDGDSALDLLSKIKSYDAQIVNNTNNNNTGNLEMNIYSWSNKLYNIQNAASGLQYKSIAFYKPNLNIHNNQYCKLGDIVSQDVKYNIPSENEFTLLIKKNSSDIKPPKSFDLIVDISNSTFNPTYYKYSQFINDDLQIINNTSSDITNCALAFDNLNTLIQSNLSSIQLQFKNIVYDDSNITIGGTIVSISRLITGTDSTTNERFDTTNNVVEGFIVPPGVVDFGCFKDKPDSPAIKNKLSNATTVDDCLQQAIQKKYDTFSLQKNASGETMCFAGNARDFKKYGAVDSCSETGDVNINRVYTTSALPYTYLGAYGDDENDRAVKTYTRVVSSVKECYDIAKTGIYDVSYPNENIFGLETNGMCFVGSTTSKQGRPISNYNKYGTRICNADLGCPWTISVYSTDAAPIPTLPLKSPKYTAPAISTLDISTNISADTLFRLPAGTVGKIYDYDNIAYDISIPAGLDLAQNKNKQLIVNKLPITPFKNLNTTNIEIATLSKRIFELIPTKIIISYINELCKSIKSIYTNYTNVELLKFLKLVNIKVTIDTILSIISAYSQTDIANNKITFEDIYSRIIKPNINQTTLLGLVFSIIDNMSISYDLTYVIFKPSQLNITTAQIADISNCNNNIIQNIPVSTYNINTNYNNQINLIIPNLNNFSLFTTSFSNKSIGYFPLQIYKPNPPDGYTALGHVFCNTTSDLQNIINVKSVACVPSHCVKEMREWIANDKIFEYSKDNVYWAIYLNPYTGTFISINTSASQLPDGKVCKVIACVAKCNEVEDLKKADDCTRKYYNMNKQANANTKLVPSLFSDQEEEYYLEKIKAQSDSISRLSNRAQTMQTTIDKSNIINREMNKNKLQTYVDTQKRNIDIVMNKLQDDKNKIQTNVKIPVSTINDILNMIKNSKIPNKNDLINKIMDNRNLFENNDISQNQYNSNINSIVSSCPDYNLAGLVKKSLVSDVCYGCDNAS